MDNICKETTIEQSILKRIEELEKHQKEQDRKLEWLYNRIVPVP